MPGALRCSLLPLPAQDIRLVQAGFQCIELVCSDFLPFLPKEYIPRALEVVAAFTKQVRGCRLHS
jgi:hypothetical protein